jgi:prepilin-type N-terminal cleavage/methylation domain-containing protein
VILALLSEMTTKGTTDMVDRYRRIQREIQEHRGDGEDGFTLIELLIVIVVIGILAAVTVFGLSNVTGQSLTSACHADARSVSVAVEAYHAQNSNTWPTMAQLTGTDPNTRYLRTLPGNTGKYLINTSGGVVTVANLTLQAGPVDFENFAPGPDPCAGL